MADPQSVAIPAIPNDFGGTAALADGEGRNCGKGLMGSQARDGDMNICDTTRDLKRSILEPAA